MSDQKISKEREYYKKHNNFKKLMHATGADTKGALAQISDSVNIGEHKSIKINYLKDYPEHTYTIYEEEDLKSLAESIKQHGLLQPILVWLYNNEYIILSGHNRRKACELAGLTSIDCIVKDNISPAEAKAIVNITNMNQRGFSDLSLYDKCKSILQLREALKDIYNEKKEKYGLDEAKGFNNNNEIAQAYKMKPSQITLYIKIGTVFKKDWYSLVPAIINLKTAYALCQLSDKNLKKIISYVFENNAEGKLIKITESQAKELKKLEEENMDAEEMISYIEKPKPQKAEKRQFIIDFSSDEYKGVYDKLKKINKEELNAVIFAAIQSYIKNTK